MTAPVQKDQELELLGRYCSVVYIDPDRREVLSPMTETVPPQARATVDVTPVRGALSGTWWGMLGGLLIGGPVFLGGSDLAEHFGL